MYFYLTPKVNHNEHLPQKQLSSKQKQSKEDSLKKAYTKKLAQLKQHLSLMEKLYAFSKGNSRTDIGITIAPTVTGEFLKGFWADSLIDAHTLQKYIQQLETIYTIRRWDIVCDLFFLKFFNNVFKHTDANGNIRFTCIDPSYESPINLKLLQQAVREQRQQAIEGSAKVQVG